jgi:predicted MFS family arabinose efflux permease
MPYIAKEVYHVDETVLGYLVASHAAGALIGSIILSTASDRVRLERVIMISIIGWYLVLLVFANVDHIAIGFACLVGTGLAQSFSMTPLSVLLMRASSPQFRGRVMGVRMLAIYGLPIGLLGAGALIEWIGYAATGTLYAAIGLLVTVAIMVRWRADVWHPMPAAAGMANRLGVDAAEA